ncbi:duf1168 domain-containing protein [Moniliophthora roreri MCA 2997]|uniref:Duf1168 domain-containing protein n=1 Tax=Moniliophthora roreri (strain MCA 2997) TaxID=1381753 RepID=V2XW99_MONRO|nr:duf1168 domain-containing protein [Moniliophthora roreri MCA 2997]
MSPPESESSKPANHHVLTAVERQKAQLEKLLKDPSKPAHVPPPPKEKTIRPAREMMKNVQGSSAGAGSGEFHVYKASRRREYERLNLLEEESRKEAEAAEFEQRRAEAEAASEAKTAKNRAKRQKKKERSRAAKEASTTGEGKAEVAGSDAPLKKRRLINGKELVFKRPGEDDDGEDSGGPQPESTSPDTGSVHPTAVVGVPENVAEESRVTIHDD